MNMRLLVIALAVLGLAACSKKNTIDASSVTGVECTGEADPACGKGGACVLGYCRIPCDIDDDCPEGALCIGSAELSGCQLVWDAFCNVSQPCKPGLTCGSDHTCRMPCNTTTDCPRADLECVQKACMNR